MADRLPPHFVQLVWEATHKSFWRRQSLWAFLRRSGIKDSFLATWHEDETKRDFLNRLFPFLETTDRGRRAISRIADSLLEQKSFLDLEGWDNSSKLKSDAQRAIGALRLYMTKKREDAASKREQEHTRKRAAEIREQQIRQQHDLSKLSDRLNALASELGTSQAGYAFQDWFYDLVEYFELQHRRPYVTKGRQIDGSITHGDTTYLVELKFTSDPAGGPDADTFRRKVESKADNTMGIMVSMSGFTGPAKEAASGERSPLLLLGYQHLYAVLGGVLTLGEAIARVRRYASQTGKAFFELDELG